MLERIGALIVFLGAMAIAVLGFILLGESGQKRKIDITVVIMGIIVIIWALVFMILFARYITMMEVF